MCFGPLHSLFSYGEEGDDSVYKSIITIQTPNFLKLVNIIKEVCVYIYIHATFRNHKLLSQSQKWYIIVIGFGPRSSHLGLQQGRGEDHETSSATSRANNEQIPMTKIRVIDQL